MICTNCQSEIDAKWKHAVSTNICPFCGEKIFSDELNKVISDSKDVLDSIQDEFRSNFEDWLLSNYSLINLKTLKTKIEEKDKAYLDKVKAIAKDAFNHLISGASVQLEQKRSNQIPSMEKLPLQNSERIEPTSNVDQIRKNAGLDVLESRRKEAASKIKQHGRLGSGASDLVLDTDSDLAPADDQEISRLQKMVSEYSEIPGISITQGDYDSDDSDDSDIMAKASMLMNPNSRDLQRLQSQVDRSQGSGRSKFIKRV